ncbi:hypothetical protein T265_01657 [Opisthorchis viverrini]|uniref:Uncharacterized protein n=1 Tax=Opisthorchis viverrini TaxID=6198 RepID=A0A075AIU1_OPIVI|nr:hypothetical protein T265_01657 [Opisthorchis viverrini]KER32224.1 hypothetical protein T265_01657 [Opisthorchis viverrini]
MPNPRSILICSPVWFYWETRLNLSTTECAAPRPPHVSVGTIFEISQYIFIKETTHKIFEVFSATLCVVSFMNTSADQLPAPIGPTTTATHVKSRHAPFCAPTRVNFEDDSAVQQVALRDSSIAGTVGVDISNNGQQWYQPQRREQHGHKSLHGVF